MSAEKTNRNKYLKIRISAKELEAIRLKASKTTSKKTSDYVRRILFDKPVITYFRNQSFDDFMAEMAALRNELNAIANNYNQVVKRLYALQHLDEIKLWASVNESSKQILHRKIDEINSKIAQINDKWLQL